MYKMGIVGYGGMGSWHHRKLADFREIEVTAAYDIKEERRKLAMENGLAVYQSLEEILADEAIDIILIATPNNFHKEYAVKALRAGKNVICEKPVTIGSAELEEIIKVQKETGKLFSVHQNRRWDKDFRIVKKVLQDNTIGTPFYIESRVQGSKGVPGDWRCVKEVGGGMLYDWGVHLIDQIMWMVKSPVVEVYDHILSVKFKDVDDNFKLLLKFENGLSALIEVDTYTFIALPRWHVSGDEGTMVVKDWACEGEIVKAKVTEMKWEESIVQTASGPTKTMAPRPVEALQTLELPEIETNSIAYYENIVAVLNGKEELIVKPEEALRVMNVIDAAFLSAEKGEAIHTHI